MAVAATGSTAMVLDGLPCGRVRADRVGRVLALRGRSCARPSLDRRGHRAAMDGPAPSLLVGTGGAVHVPAGRLSGPAPKQVHRHIQDLPHALRSLQGGTPPRLKAVARQGHRGQKRGGAESQTVADVSFGYRVNHTTDRIRAFIKGGQKQICHPACLLVRLLCCIKERISRYALPDVP